MEADLEILSYVNESSKMTTLAIKDLIKILEEKKNNIKKELKETLLTFESYTKESKKMIDKKKEKDKDLKFSTKAMTKMGIKKEIKKDNSDSAVAHMIIEGLTIGIIDIESLISKYEKEADKKVIKYIKEYLDFNKKQVENYKEYL